MRNNHLFGVISFLCASALFLACGTGCAAPVASTKNATSAKHSATATILDTSAELPELMPVTNEVDYAPATPRTWVLDPSNPTGDFTFVKLAEVGTEFDRARFNGRPTQQPTAATKYVAPNRGNCVWQSPVGDFDSKDAALAAMRTEHVGGVAREACFEETPEHVGKTKLRVDREFFLPKPAALQLGRPKGLGLIER